ncbi:unnamed protein product [Leptosia nina]|uniref:Ionotropic receptor n=1 Tax=Leptosia nina TaxID=320188 RepID=A0AAV1J9I4_9NEOP
MALFDRLTGANCSTYDALALSAAKVAIHNFRWQYATLILFNPTAFCGVDVFIKSYKKCFLIGQSTFNTWVVENTRQFVLFLSDGIDLIAFLEWLKSQRFNNTGRYIIICNSLSQLTCDEDQAVRLLWEYRISNVVLIKFNATRRPVGLTYFQDGDCRNSPPIELKHWTNCTQLNDIGQCQQMFPLKFKNLHQCPLIASTFEQKPYMTLKNGIPEGADGYLLRTIVQALNASLIVMTPKLGTGWGKLEENGTWSGSLSDVYYDWANFSMTSASVTLHRFRYFQMSKDYNTVTLGWVTHPSNKEPSLFKLLRPYSTEAVIFLCLVFLFILFVALLLKSKHWTKIRNKLNVGEPPEGILFHSWEICMGMPASKLPNNPILLYFVLLWIINCFMLRTLYQVYLINSIQADIRIDSISKVEDAIALGYPFGGGLALKDFFIDYPLIYNNYKNIESHQIYPTMVNMSQGMKFVIAMNLESTKAFLKEPSRKLHILPREIVKSPTVLFFKKYSWLADSIDSILTTLFESGIVLKIFKDNTFTPCKDDEDAPSPITLDDYAGCFMILAGGWITCCLFFVIEKYYFMKKVKNKK